MRPLPILPLSIFSAVFMVAAIPAASPGFAQVTVDLHALQALPNRPMPDRSTARPAHAAPPSSASTGAPMTSAKREAPAANPSPAEAPQPALPQTVPDTASINPIAPPVPSGIAPPPPPVSDNAATTAEATTAGLRLTFAAEQSDLNPESIASIKELTAKAPPGDDTTFNVQAYAPGKRDDPSTARRVSLSRAMAVRSALVADGVPSARIFVRALGEQYGDGPPDRVDISVTGRGTAASGSGAAVAR